MTRYLLLITICSVMGCAKSKDNLSNRAPMHFIKSVRQKGPVAYRDPFGSISPDGKLFAYSDRKEIAIQQVAGGATFKLEKHGTFVITLTWHPDSDHLITYEVGGDKSYWYSYNLQTKQGTPLWPDKNKFIHKDFSIERNEMKDLTWSANGKQVAGLSAKNGSTQVWIMNDDGSNSMVITEKELIESIQWNPKAQAFAGIVEEDGKRYIQLDLTNESSKKINADSYGPIAFSPDGKFLYFSLANEKQVVDLQQYDLARGSVNQLAGFSRDSYAPSVANDGSVLFRLQDYKVFIAAVDGDGGESQPITTFMSEISHWHPDGKLLSFTYGNWRRVMDDRNYPDITQEIGYITFNINNPADKPDVIVRASYSEDQGMCWSPNNKWIAFHTHADGTDDIWIQPNNDASKGKPLSKGGYETGWPRWSPDGKWIVSNTALTADRINKLFLIGIDQETGEPTTAQTELIPPGLEEGSFTDSQWTNDSKNLVIEYVVTPEMKEIHIVPINGKKGRRIHTFKSDQLYSGIALSHDQKWIAYIAPDTNGNFQVYKVSIDGKEVIQLTFDATNKAHPAASPTDDIFSFTVFNYESIFWLMKPAR